MDAASLAPDGRQSILELNRLIAQARGFFNDLEHVSGLMLAEEQLSPRERRVMMGLRKHGPSTVPRLAGRQKVSRQYVQTTVNELEARRLVEFRDNPEHRKSRLVALSGPGQELILKLMAREGEAMHKVAAGLRPEQVREAVAVLSRARELLTEHIR